MGIRVGLVSQREWPVLSNDAGWALLDGEVAGGKGKVTELEERALGAVDAVEVAVEGISWWELGKWGIRILAAVARRLR